VSALEAVLRAALTATFLLSAAGKTMALEKSARMLSGLVPLPGRPMALALVGAEALTATAVATAQNGPRADFAAGAALALVLLFAGASIRASLAGQRLLCACFGSLSPAQSLGWRTLVRARVIAAAAAGWRAAISVVQPSASSAADRAALSFVAAAAVASLIAWTHWRAGIAHRRFAANAIYLQRLTAGAQTREPG
jgi:Methylamine utilisation protein MauE